MIPPMIKRKRNEKMNQFENDSNDLTSFFFFFQIVIDPRSEVTLVTLRFGIAGYARVRGLITVNCG